MKLESHSSKAVGVLTFIFFLFAPSCTTPSTKHVVAHAAYHMDQERNRVIPLEIYENSAANYQQGLVVISAGYGSSNTEYSFIARFLSEKDYLVVATHHEQATDQWLPTGDSIFQKRLPFWDEGTRNIDALLSYVSKEYPEVSTEEISLIGHSNGGDISVLYAVKHLGKVRNLITLDHRRMPLPRNASFKTLTFRSNDYQADPGVLPPDSMADQGIRVVNLDAGHNYMRDNGTEAMKKAILSELDGLL